MGRWIAIGFIATGLIVLTFGYSIANEEDRQAEAAARFQADDIEAATDIYAENCAVCHGAAGEGIASNPPLNSAALRSADSTTLFKTVSRGLYGTVMAAWAVDEGGVLSHHQIEQLITLIYHGDWNTVMLRVDELGMTPPEPITIELDEATLTEIQQLPDGIAIANGVQVYNQECVACHGTELAPSLTSPDALTRLSDADLARIINDGVPSTLMAGWSNVLTPQEVSDVVTFIRNYEALATAGIELPAAPPPVEIELTPELIAEGEWLYDILCTQCHGTIGQGTPMAPALNSQGFLADTPDAAIVQIIAGGVPGTQMPAWGGRLTEADLMAITAFIRSWEPTAPPVAR